MRRGDKILVYAALSISLIIMVLVASTNVQAFPGNEILAIVSVSDNRTDPSQTILWNVSVLNNVTFWVNITVDYNGTTNGPYNVSLTPPLNAVFNDTTPATYGNYTVIIATPGIGANDTLVGFLVDLYNIDVDALYTEVEATFNTLIYANGSSVLDGHELTEGDTLIINGVTLTWNSYLGRFEGTTTSAAPATVAYNTLTSLIEATYTITNGNITSYPTVTWTTQRLELITPFMRLGDWPGAIIEINVILMGQSIFWTFLLTAMSLAVYNYSGPEVALLSWMFGWSMFSTVVHGQALTISLIFMAVGGGIYIAKFFLDRRTSV